MILSGVLATASMACSVDASNSGSAIGTDAGAAPTSEDGAPGSSATETVDCTKTAIMREGWSESIGPDYVELTREDAQVELNYAIVLDDELRGDGNVIQNLWTRVLGKRFTTGPRNTSDRSFIHGPATEIASGISVFIGFVSVTTNGVARPVVGITKDEASFFARFKDRDGLSDMHRFNRFPLTCGALQGAWSTSFAVAGSSPGSVTGISVSSYQLDLSFNGESYHYDETAHLDTRREKLIEDGNFRAGEQAIVLTSTQGRVTSFDASYVAVRGGLALFLVNRQFSGDRTLLVR